MAASQDLADRYIALAIQGDLRDAKVLLEDAAESSEATELDNLRTQFGARFIERSESPTGLSGNPFLDQVVAAYRAYWASVMMGEQTIEEGNRELESRLAGLLDDGKELTGANVYEALGQEIENAGYHYFNNAAPPYRELFLWKTQRVRSYHVALTDTSRTVRVAFMDDFVSLGWKHYATLGLASTTGWVEAGMLYCVDWAYDTGSENFEVSYLKHEARHLADLERYPDLPTSELEYRAKLTELAYAWRSVGRLLSDFTAKSADNPDSAHAQANFRLTHDLYDALYGQPLPAGNPNPWAEVSRSRINRAARALLERDTRQLQRLAAAGAKTHSVHSGGVRKGTD
ncbi:MAG: hypothetical protein PVJ33_17465 [Lysobacterales bacterium]